MSKTPPRNLVDDWDEDPWDDPVELYDDDFEKPPRKSGGLKYLVFGGGAVAAVMLLLAFGVGIWAMRQISPAGEQGDAVLFVVNPDDTVKTVAARLEDEGIITDARVFEEYVERRGGLELTPGNYSLLPRDTMGNIQKILQTPPDQTLKDVLFIEGWTLGQMDAQLNEKMPHIPPGALVQAGFDCRGCSQFQPIDQPIPEGLAFPDTYEIGGNESADSVYRRMVNVMDRVAIKEGVEQSQEKLGYSPYEVLIVASMIEKESGAFDEDRQKIAAVIYNRLGLGVPLQIDATLYYAQPADTPFDVLKATDSPYNTYMHGGLPPTPIASPSRASIRAAMNPAPNPEECSPPPEDDFAPADQCLWLYYVLSDAEGHHAFATNLAEHEVNVQTARDAGLLG